MYVKYDVMLHLLTSGESRSLDM